MSEEKDEKLTDIKDIALEDEEKKPEKLPDMSLDDSTPKDFEARIKKLFPTEQYIYITADAPLCRLKDGSYSLRSIPIADLTDDWKEKLDEFLKSKENE